MRKIKILAHISLDGVVTPSNESEYANGGWTAPYRTPDGAQAIADAQGANFDLLLGRGTYDLWASYWPIMKGGPFADRFNAAKKFVATHRPDSLGWGPAESLGTDVTAGVRRVMSTDGPDLIVWGSTTLTPALFKQGLVDEVVLVVYPLLLGGGKMFFSDRAVPRELALVTSTAMSTGALLNTYRPVGSPRNWVAPAK
jgi:dihydrofolate reductase